MKPAPNETWEVKTPSLDNEQAHFSVSPLHPKRNGFQKKVVVSAVPPMVLAAAEEMEVHVDDRDGLLYSQGHDCSSFASLSTRSSNNSPSVLSRKSSSTSSTKSRRKQRKTRCIPSTKERPVFDPRRKPKKSCLKKGAKQPPLQRPRSFYKVDLPGKLGTVKRRRTVQYNEQVFIREFQSAISLVENCDAGVLWWQNDETDIIKENLQRILSRVDKKGIARTNGKRYCTRGLERFLDPSTNCEKDQHEAAEAVFDEQNVQKNRRTFDEMKIAACYVLFTKTSERRALRRGCEDAMTAASIFGEGAMENSLFRNSFSSGSLRASTHGTIGSPKRSSSFTSFPKRPVSFRKPISFRRKQQTSSMA